VTLAAPGGSRTHLGGSPGRVAGRVVGRVAGAPFAAGPAGAAACIQANKTISVLTETA
jgi:hypothetical protein